MRKSKYSQMVLWVARTEDSLAVTWAVSPVCLELSHSHRTLLEKLPFKHIWRTCSNLSQFICPRSLLYLVCIAGVRWRSSFVFRSTGISSSSSIAFSWLTSMYGPVRGSCVQEFFLCPVKVTSLQSSGPTWNYFHRFHLFQTDHPQRYWRSLPRIFL